MQAKANQISPPTPTAPTSSPAPQPAMAQMTTLSTTTASPSALFSSNSPRQTTPGRTTTPTPKWSTPFSSTGPKPAAIKTSPSGNKDLAQPLSTFYSDAAAGNLPEFSFIDPSCCGVGTNSMHPTGLISDGEAFIKNVYDALRASPQWNETLFILTFDETGGFHDHVPPPLAVRPDNLTYTETAPNGEKYTFSFDRLGGRIPTILISPWVAKGLVEQKGTDSNGKTVSYSASSILRTLGYLWDFAPFTPRVGSSASFDHLIRNVKRDDTPTALPEPKAFKAKH